MVPHFFQFVTNCDEKMWPTSGLLAESVSSIELNIFCLKAVAQLQIFLLNTLRKPFRTCSFAAFILLVNMSAVKIAVLLLSWLVAQKDSLFPGNSLPFDILFIYGKE